MSRHPTGQRVGLQNGGPGWGRRMPHGAAGTIACQAYSFIFICNW